jgi:hypothetical protein
MPIFPTITSVFDALKKHITLALFILSLAASALFIYSWLDARRSAAQLAATLASQQKIITAATSAQSARDAALTQSLAQIAALERQVQTPQQASAALAQSLPQFVDTTTGSPLPAPLQFIPFPTTNSATANSSAPQSQSSAANCSPGSLPAGRQGPNLGTSAPCPPSANSSQQGIASSGKSGSDQSSPSAAQQNVVILSGAKPRLPAGRDPVASPTTTATTTASSVASSSAPSAPAGPPSEPSPKAGALSYLKSQIASVRSLTSPSTPSTPPHAPGELATSHGNPSAQQGPPAGASAQAGNPPGPIPGSICIPPLDLKPLYDSIEDCEACAAKLTAAQSDLSDETVKFNAASAERDAAIKSAHGTFWSRALTAAKWIAIGAAAGAVIAKYH